MHTFFHGWRRKIGCVTLVMACVLMGGWIRSYKMLDVVAFPLTDRQQAIFTTEGVIYWWGNPSTPKWGHESTLMQSAVVRTSMEKTRRMLSEVAGAEFREWEIPHSSLTIPLALLSVYLILWKPRKRV